MGMSEDLASVEEKIGRLMDRELRERLDTDLRGLEDSVNQIKGEEERRECLELVRRLREVLLGEAEAHETYRDFEARLRFSGASLLITIPVKVVQELGLEPGERTTFRIRKSSRPAASHRGVKG